MHYYVVVVAGQANNAKDKHTPTRNASHSATGVSFKGNLVKSYKSLGHIQYF